MFTHTHGSGLLEDPRLRASHGSVHLPTTTMFTYTHPERSLLHPCTHLLDPMWYQINLLIRWSKTRTFHQAVMDMSVNRVHTASNHLYSHAVYIIDTLLLKTVKQQAWINMPRRGAIDHTEVFPSSHKCCTSRSIDTFISQLDLALTSEQACVCYCVK